MERARSAFELLTEARAARGTAPCGGISEPEAGVFLIAGHDDVCTVMRDAATFRQGGYFIREHVIDPDEKVMSELDDPLHRALRHVFMELVGPRRIKQYETVVRAAFDEAALEFAARGGGDVVGDIAQRVPARIIGILADVGTDMLPRVQTYANDYIRGRFHADEHAATRSREFDQHIVELIAKRRADGARRDDWLSVLLECRDDEGTPLSDVRLATMFTKDLLVGGSETTSHVLSKMFFELVRDPQLYQRLRAAPELVPTAVEESLRLFPPLTAVLRRPTRATSIAGTEVDDGSTIVVALEHANLDPTVFADPECFDVTRDATVRRHLTFGYGPHLCIGAPLARLELEQCLRAFLDRFSRLEPADGFEAELVPGALASRLVRLDVVVQPA